MLLLSLSPLLGSVKWMPIVLTPVVLLGWLALLGWWVHSVENPGPIKRKVRDLRANVGLGRRFGQLVVRAGRGCCAVVAFARMRKKVAKGVLVFIVFAGAVYLSTCASVPASLPGVAMGWTALFHVERAGALLGAVGIVVLIAWRALSGEFPIKFGNIEYQAKVTAAETKNVSALQERRIRVLEVLASIRDPSTLEDEG